ncbi:MAG: T9SS type A sorting domain-containing protein [Flavobacteriales bacterium]|nr:T9SS type A sorting domain-containing protein [Flavobacteriales bacterium]
MKKLLLSAAFVAATLFSSNVAAQCDPTATSTADVFVRYVKMVDVSTGAVLLVNETDVDTDNGYGDYTALTGMDVSSEGSYKMMLRGKLGIDNVAIPTFWKVYIDIDKDGKFDGANEEVISKTDDAWGYNGFTMPVLGNGSFKLRVMYSAAAIASPCDDIVAGEIEDYTIYVGDKAPYTVDDASAVKMNNNVIVDVLANDKKGTNDFASIIIVDAPTNGVAVINADNTITYTPTADYLGSDTFTYTVTDSKGLVSDKATVTISVVQIDGLVKIIEDFESGRGLFDRDVAGSGQSMGLEQLPPEVDAEVYLYGAQSLKATYQDGSSATIPGDFAWYDRFGVNHWANVAPADITGIDAASELYLSLSIKTTTASYGAKVSFLIKSGGFYIQSVPVLLGNHDTNWNLIQVDLKDAAQWTDWTVPTAEGGTNTIVGGSNGVVADVAMVNAIIIEGTNDSPDMILNLDNLMVTSIALIAPEVDVPTENLSAATLDLAKVNAYPNPVANTLNLDLSKEVSSVTIFSAIGSVVYTNETPTKNLAIDTQAWKAGMYFVSVKEGNNTQTLKVIK